METATIIRKTEHGDIVEIDPEELGVLLDGAETLRADDTSLAGWIRILSLDGQILAQEETPDRVILIRRLDSVQAADDFVDRRLADYERMWNGCGCKIDYRARHHDD
jgi:hypothetical protein